MRMIFIALNKLIDKWLELDDGEEVRLLEQQWQERLKQIQSNANNKNNTDSLVFSNTTNRISSEQNMERHGR